MTDTHELSITRLIDAPVDAVWRAWSGHGDEWFCPKPWRAEFVEQELRGGGRSAIVMRGPAGEENRLGGVYLEVVPGERVVSTDAFTADWHPQQPFMVRIDTFADEAGRTRYTATARHWTAEACEQHRAMGFEAGWNAATDQLEEVAKRLAGGAA
jgi:uncharacterized protein YndB with AHSA1/START domain